MAGFRSWQFGSETILFARGTYRFFVLDLGGGTGHCWALSPCSALGSSWVVAAIAKHSLRVDFVFHGALAAGISVMLGVQALINLGVNLGLLPTKGLTLPLMSFGGNSLLVSCLMIGLLLRVE